MAHDLRGYMADVDPYCVCLCAWKYLTSRSYSVCAKLAHSSDLRTQLIKSMVYKLS